MSTSRTCGTSWRGCARRSKRCGVSVINWSKNMPYSPMELADAFIRAGELADALDALNQQLIDQPADDEARRLRAQVLMRIPGEEHVQAALGDLESIASPTQDDNLRRALL